MNLDPELDIRVLYYRSTVSDREWGSPELRPYEKVLGGWTLSFLGPSAHFNPGVWSCLLMAKDRLVVVSDYSAPTAQMAMYLLSLQRRPFVFWGEVPGFRERGTVGNSIRRVLQTPLRRAHGIAAIGKEAVEAYSQLFPGIPIFNIPYFCDLQPYQHARSTRSGKSDRVNILYSGQLIERKGVDILLRAFAAIAPGREQLYLTVLGSGPERRQLEEFVSPELRDRVVFLGHKRPEELPAVFADSDIFCLPSRHDGWGIVVNEALGAGLPLVVSDAVGAARDLVVDGHNGFVLPAGDVEALAGVLSKLTDDVALRLRMSEASSALSKSWGISEGVRRWRHAAETVLASRSTP